MASSPGAGIIRRICDEYDAQQFADGRATAELDEAHPRVSQLLRLIGSPHRVLDIGISRGDFAAALARHGNRVVGVDISAQAVSLSRARGIEAYRLDVETDPLTELGEFDGALMLEIVEHLIDPLFVLRKVREIIRPGGWLVLSTPNAAYVKWRLELLRGELPAFGEARRFPSEPRPYNLFHKTPLTIGCLRRLLEMSGFRLVHLAPEDYGVSPRWDKPVVRGTREWLRRRWPSLFAGAVVVKCELAAREGSAR